MAQVNKIKRVKTGITNIDDLLGGGIPKNELVLLAGHAGPAKQFLAPSSYTIVKLNTKKTVSMRL